MRLEKGNALLSTIQDSLWTFFLGGGGYPKLWGFAPRPLFIGGGFAPQTLLTT